MRAVLLASATATTRLGRRWRSRSEAGANIGCRAWISRPGDVCRRWNSAVAPDLARPRTRAHCGSRSVLPPWRRGCGNDRADARNARQALADGVALVPGHELLLDRRNRRLQLLNLCRQ